MSHAKTLGLGTGDLNSDARPKMIRKKTKNTGLSHLNIRAKLSRIAEPRITSSENRTIRNTTTTTGTKKTATRPVRSKKSAPVVSQEPKPVVIPPVSKGASSNPPVSPRRLLFNLSRAAGILPQAHGGDFLPCWDPQEEDYSSLRPVDLTAPRHFLKTKPPRGRIPKTRNFTLSPFDLVGLEDPIGNIETQTDFHIEAKASMTCGNVSPRQSRLEVGLSRQEVPSLEPDAPYLPRLSPLSEIRLEPLSFSRLREFESRKTGGISREPHKQPKSVSLGEPDSATRRRDKSFASSAYLCEKIRAPFDTQNGPVSTAVHTAIQQDRRVPSQDTFLSRKGDFASQTALFPEKIHPCDFCRSELKVQEGRLSESTYLSHEQEITSEHFVADKQESPLYETGDFSCQSSVQVVDPEFLDPATYFREQSSPTTYPPMESPPHTITSTKTKETSSSETLESTEYDVYSQDLQEGTLETLQQPSLAQQELLNQELRGTIQQPVMPRKEFCETFQQTFSTDERHQEHGAKVQQPFSAENERRQEFCEAVQKPYPVQEELQQKYYQAVRPFQAQNERCETVQQQFSPGEGILDEYSETNLTMFSSGKELREQYCETAQQFFSGEDLHEKQSEIAQQPTLDQEEHRNYCQTVPQTISAQNAYCGTVQQSISPAEVLPEEYHETAQQPFQTQNMLHHAYYQTSQQPFLTQKELPHIHSATSQQSLLTQQELHHQHSEATQQSFLTQKELSNIHSATSQQSCLTQKELHHQHSEATQQLFLIQQELHHIHSATSQQSPRSQQELPHIHSGTSQQSRLTQQELPHIHSGTSQQSRLTQQELHQHSEAAQQSFLTQKELSHIHSATSQQSFLTHQGQHYEQCTNPQQPFPIQKEYFESAKQSCVAETIDSDFCQGQMQGNYCQIIQDVEHKSALPLHLEGAIPSINNENQAKPHRHYCWYSHKMVVPEMVHPSLHQIQNEDSGIPSPPPMDECPTLHDRNVVCRAKPTLSLCAVTSSPEDTEAEDQFDQSVTEGGFSNPILQQGDVMKYDSNNNSHVPSVKHSSCSCMNTYSCERQAKDICSRSGYPKGPYYSGDNWYYCDHGKDETLGYRTSTMQFHGDNYLDLSRHCVCHSFGDLHRVTCGLGSQSGFFREDMRNGQLQISDNKYYSTGSSITQMQSKWRVPSECWRGSIHGGCKTQCKYRAGSSPQSLSLWNPTPPPPSASCSRPSSPPPFELQTSSSQNPSANSFSSSSSGSLEKIVPSELQASNTDEAPMQRIEKSEKSESSTDCEDISSEGGSQEATPHSITSSDFEHLVPENDSPDTSSQHISTPCVSPCASSCASPCPTLGSQRESDKAHKEDADIGSRIRVPEETVQTGKVNGAIVGSSLKKATPFTMTLGQSESLPNPVDDAASIYVHGDEVLSVSDDDTQDADETGDAGDSLDRASDVSSASSAGISENEVTDLSASSNEPRLFVPTALSVRVTVANLPILLCVVAVSIGSLLLYQNQTY